MIMYLIFQVDLRNFSAKHMIQSGKSFEMKLFFLKKKTDYILKCECV